MSGKALDVSAQERQAQRKVDTTLAPNANAAIPGAWTTPSTPRLPRCPAHRPPADAGEDLELLVRGSGETIRGDRIGFAAPENRDIDRRGAAADDRSVLAQVLSAALVGVEAALVRVEVDVASGLPNFMRCGAIPG